MWDVITTNASKGSNRILHMSAIVRQGDAGSRLVRMVDTR